MPFICKNPSKYKSKIVDNGQCVSFVQVAAGVPNTKLWKQGLVVKGNYGILTGTAIATFVDGKYPNWAHGNHAAIYVKQDDIGIWVWEQWKGHPVSYDCIKFNDNSGLLSRNGYAYSVIEEDKK